MQILFYDTGETLHNAETSFLRTVLLKLRSDHLQNMICSFFENLNTDLCKVCYNSETLNGVPISYRRHRFMGRTNTVRNNSLKSIILTNYKLIVIVFVQFRGHKRDLMSQYDLLHSIGHNSQPKADVLTHHSQLHTKIKSALNFHWWCSMSFNRERLCRIAQKKRSDKISEFGNLLRLGAPW